MKFMKKLFATKAGSADKVNCPHILSSQMTICRPIQVTELAITYPSTRRRLSTQ